MSFHPPHSQARGGWDGAPVALHTWRWGGRRAQLAWKQSPNGAQDQQRATCQGSSCGDSRDFNTQEENFISLSPDTGKPLPEGNCTSPLNIEATSGPLTRGTEASPGHTSLRHEGLQSAASHPPIQRQAVAEHSPGRKRTQELFSTAEMGRKRRQAVRRRGTEMVRGQETPWGTAAGIAHV